jgi:nucleoside-diphosphate-sugar epimerase
MRVLILGGTGFIGPFLVPELVEAGHEVILFHRGRTEADLPAEVRHVHGDLEQFAEHLPELRVLEPEIVVDMIPYRAEHGPRVRQFAGVARRGVVLSSADVYLAYGRIDGSAPGPPLPMPVDEDGPVRDRLSSAGEAYNKTAVEKEAAADPSFPVTILRLPAIHGPGDRQHRLWQYLKRMDDGRARILLEERMAAFRWSRGYVEDMAHAVALAVTSEAASGRTYNVAEANAYAEADWVRRLAGVIGWTGEVLPFPNEQLPESMRESYDGAQSLVLDTGRIRAELGYSEVVPEEEALRRTIEWERRNPPPEGKGPTETDYAAEDAAWAEINR